MQIVFGGICLSWQWLWRVCLQPVRNGVRCPCGLGVGHDARYKSTPVTGAAPALLLGPRWELEFGFLIGEGAGLESYSPGFEHPQVLSILSWEWCKMMGP